MTKRHTLTRLPRSNDDQPRYFHPHGYVIERERRSWSERGIPHIGGPPPLFTWKVQYHLGLRRGLVFEPNGALRRGRSLKFLAETSERYARDAKDFGTLGEARAWCDTNQREGWTDA